MSKPSIMFVKKAVLLLLQVGSPIWRAAESLDFGHNDDSVLCRVLLIETLSEDFSSQIETACVPIIDNEEIDTSIVMGNIPTVHDYVRITKAVYQEKSLLTSNQSQVIPVQPASHFRRLRNQDPSSILMVRISTLDLILAHACPHNLILHRTLSKNSRRRKRDTVASFRVI